MKWAWEVSPPANVGNLLKSWTFFGKHNYFQVIFLVKIKLGRKRR